MREQSQKERLERLIKRPVPKKKVGVVRQINRCFSLQIKTDILMLNAA